MARLIVSSLTYHISTVIFYLLCLSGLIWQVTQISMNYFKFDTIKDISVILPEEVKDARRVINICFDNEDIFDYDRYVDLLNKTYYGTQSYAPLFESRYKKQRRNSLLYSFSVGDRFDITKHFLLRDIRYEEFIIGVTYCLQVHGSTTHNPFLMYYDLDNVSTLYVSHSHPLPFFDFKRLKPIDVAKVKVEEKDVHVTSYFYSIKRLVAPYRDDCIDYAIYGRSHKYDAIVDCINNETLNSNKLLAPCKGITKNDTMFLNRTTFYGTCEEMLSCYKRYEEVDCDETVYFTIIEAKDNNAKIHKDKAMEIFKAPNAEPSFVIESKPRIDDIEYVTYIFGALGSWFGFSFLMLNPVPYLFRTRRSSPNNAQVDPNPSEAASPQQQTNEKLASLEDETIRLKTRMSMIEREKVVMNSDADKHRLVMESRISQLINRISVIENGNAS